ncbi:SRSO17 transposase [Thermocatellispora tengchongensis]|uniref:SRSO17 transposase n=1 Tax=Thermocatellispora tengchongensis TaxID=1073253 RepID=A0A840PS10_9ACTN|nr:SRSO17 transposase [Thermocatellispora tengchongensis]
MAALARVEHLSAARLQAGLDDAFALVAGRFRRPEVRQRARACVGELLSGLERKNGWSLAEYAGEATPDGMQRLFNAAKWDVDGVRDDIRTYLIQHLGEHDGVLVGDDTGFAKQGTHSAGVQRRYTGTLGKVANCQIGVFLGYASSRGRAVLDRELYLPKDSWIARPERCADARVPEQVGFATKPQLLQAMIERALAAGVPFGWVTADEAYGDNGPLRRYLEDQQISYVLAVSRAHQITTGAGKVRADIMAGKVPRTGWQRLSCGPGAKGDRRYAWALVATGSPAHHLLVRRSLSNPRDLAFYLCHTPRPVPLQRLVEVAGARWTIEECFQTGKNEAAFDHYQVRLYPAWYRYITLAMLALAFLAVTRAALGARHTPAGTGPLVDISANEIRRVFALLTRPPTSRPHILHWSRWRRRHQARARQSHYQRRQLRDR